ncbi:MAG: DUF924 domain-containing protein [Novosphingobium sp.]|nr:DUF924 domain-containing protein [Novosphingobium sp.]
MSAATRPWAAQLLHLWFHRLRPAQWFGRNASLDEELRRRFGRQLVALGNRQPAEFLGDPLTARAAILLFDQCPRNTLRDDPKAFAFDPLALAICKGALARGWDQGLTVPQRQFIAMPLMHSEDIADQLACLTLFAEFGSPFLLSFARSHWRMIAKFGRFPHRNEVLGRKSTPAELDAIAAGHAW